MTRIWSMLRLPGGLAAPLLLLGLAGTGKVELGDGLVIALGLAFTVLGLLPLLHHVGRHGLASLIDGDFRQNVERAFFEKSADAYLLFDDPAFIAANPQAVKVIGCSTESQVLLVHPGSISPEYQPDGRRSDEKGLVAATRG